MGYKEPKEFWAVMALSALVIAVVLVLFTGCRPAERPQIIILRQQAPAEPPPVNPYAEYLPGGPKYQGPVQKHTVIERHYANPPVYPMPSYWAQIPRETR